MQIPRACFLQPGEPQLGLGQLDPRSAGRQLLFTRANDEPFELGRQRVTPGSCLDDLFRTQPRLEARQIGARASKPRRRARALLGKVERLQLQEGGIGLDVLTLFDMNDLDSPAEP